MDTRRKGERFFVGKYQQIHLATQQQELTRTIKNFLRDLMNLLENQTCWLANIKASWAAVKRAFALLKLS